ncbi:hypothetical protein BB558_001432, partial [Smittium angustum]
MRNAKATEDLREFTKPSRIYEQIPIHSKRYEHKLRGWENLNRNTVQAIKVRSEE